MKFYADLHIHSSYSRATSSELSLEQLNAWGQIKGIRLIGTGDCLHPAWFSECRNKLHDDGSGLFSLKPEYAEKTKDLVPASCSAPVRFMLNVEISSIYKKNGKVRKIHNVVCMPSLASVEKLITRLERIGNLKSDGRPILGLDAQTLLEIALECDPQALLIPAHIWTPWFSALGSKSGFDSIQECFGDLTRHIYAVETGLSSDPLMNWRLSSLDPFALVSSSDAHSPSKLGRECTVFDTALTYGAIYRALADPADNGLAGTVEFFPEEGKYHVDGHRKCEVRFTPQETIDHNGLCPKCGKPLTVGVLSRVEELADRPQGIKPPRARPFKSQIPLCEVLSESLGSGPATKTVTEAYHAIIRNIGSEFTILFDTEIPAIAAVAGDVVAEGIRRMRNGDATIAAGYDGEFGTVHLFTESQRRSLAGQENLFGPEEKKKVKKTGVRTKSVRQKKTPRDTGADAGPTPEEPEDILSRLNDAQKKAVLHEGKRLLIIAGPGTGKTHTLTRRIARSVEGLESGQRCLALTFTNKAAAEMRDRLDRFGKAIGSCVYTGTIHALCLSILRDHAEEAGLLPSFEIAGPDEIESTARGAWPDMSAAQRRANLDEMARIKASSPGDAIPEFISRFDGQLRANGFIDFDTILCTCLTLLRGRPPLLQEVRSRFPRLFIDEYQDINAVQHDLIVLLAGEDGAITAIGDPHQSIYGFRGSTAAFFESFAVDFPGAAVVTLDKNYRTVPAILTAFGQVIGGLRGSGTPALVAVRKGTGGLFISETSSGAAEAEYAVHSIERLVGGTSMFSHDSGRVGHTHAGGYGFSDIAVLYRMSALRRDMEEALHRSGIPFTVTGEQPFHAKTPVVQILALLRFAAGEAVGLDALMAILESAISGLTLQSNSALRTGLSQGPRRTDRETLRALLSRASMPGDCAKSAASFFNTVEAVGDLIAACSIEQALALCATLPPSRPDSERSPETKETFERLMRMARTSPSFKKFMDTVLINREEDGAWGTSESVSLLTLHASKGLEWPVVFIIGCEDGILPLSRVSEPVDIAEERRLLYVGMSRAKDLLYLTHVKCRVIHGEKRACHRSPFLADIDETLVQRDFEGWGRKPKPKPDAEQLSLF
jgi:DNA helicase II / ATP-dependent DNA helicase PcrA